MQTLLYNKNKHVSRQKLDDMILELRQLINEKQVTKSNKKVSDKQAGQKNICKPKNIESLIQQTSKLLEKSQKKKNLKPSIRGKIMAASQILKDQNELIKSYVRDKIESQLFSSKIENQQLKNSYLQEQKLKIIRLKQKQLEKENKNRKQIIENVKQFNQNSRVKVSIHEIDSLIYKEDPNSSYLLNHENGKKIVSNSNEIKNSNQFFKVNQQNQQDELINNPNGLSKSSFNNSRSKFLNNAKTKSQHIQPQFDQEFKQFTQQPEGYEKFTQLETNNPAAIGLNNVLTKYPHLVKIFYTFLKNQIKINNLDSAFNFMSQILNDQKASIKQFQKGQDGDSFFWKSNKGKRNNISFEKQGKKAATISNIIQKYRFKGFGINQDAKVQFQRRKVSERRINKMIGQSKNFHPKKCILTKNQLIYYEEKDKSQQTSSSMLQMCLPEATKKIELNLQRIQILNFSKQQGSFFSKKQMNIQIVDLKGKNRGIKFQKNFLEGPEIVQDLKKLMANKLYRNISILKGSNNINLYEFINNPHSKQLQFMGQNLPSSSQKQQKHMLIITDLSSNRKHVQALKINNTKFPLNQLNEIFLQSKQFQKLKKIHLIHLKLNNQSFLALCQFVNDIFSKTQLQVILKDTKLDDECFTSNVGSFTSFCSKVKFLDISQNNISAKTIQIIKNCLESVTTIIQRLNISYCPIMDIMKITSMIKEARKLQILDAQCCDLDLDLVNQLQLQKAFEFLKKCTPTFKKLNLRKNGALKPKQYEIIQKMWAIETIQCIQIDVDFKYYKNSQKPSQSIKKENQLKSAISSPLYMEINRADQTFSNSNK